MSHMIQDMYSVLDQIYRYVFIIIIINIIFIIISLHFRNQEGATA